MNTEFLLGKQGPLVDFPLLTYDGEKAVLSTLAWDSGRLCDECICLAWVGSIGLAVYFIPPNAIRHSAAFFVFCGARRLAAVVPLDDIGGPRSLEGLGSAIDACAESDLDKHGLDAVLSGIAAELFLCVEFFQSRLPVFGDEYNGGTAPYERLVVSNRLAEFRFVHAEQVAIARALFHGLGLSVYLAYVGEDDPRPNMAFAHRDKEDGPITNHRVDGVFGSGLSAAIEDYRYRRPAYKTQIEKAKPKRSTRIRELLWNSYPHICGICGNRIDSFGEMHVDHIIPLSRGGKDILANLQLTHAKCNLKKGSDMPEGDDEGEGTDDDTEC